MQIRVLGCSTSDLPDVHLSSFLLDNKMLFDAGTILSALDEHERLNIEHIFISHSHLDHIKDLPFFAENILMIAKDHQLKVVSIAEVNQALQDNIFNGLVWPDYTRLPEPGSPIIIFKNLDPGIPFHVEGYTITAYKVNHTVPAVGFLVEDGEGKRLLYLGDAGPSNSVWESINGNKIHGLIIEVSFPDSLTPLANRTGHLTPSLLQAELNKISILPDNIFITHCKPQFKNRVAEELGALDVPNMKMLSCGTCLEI